MDVEVPAATGEIGGLEDMEVAGLMKARSLGLLSAETVFAEMQRRGLISDDIEWNDEQARLLAEGPRLAAPGAKESAMRQTPPMPAAPAPTADFTPLVASIASLVLQLAKPDPAEPPEKVDFAPLIEAIRAIPAPSAPMVTVEAPTITVNVPEQPAPQVNFAAGAIQVDAPVTINEAPITVEGSTHNVMPAQVIQPKASKVDFALNADGEITGATLN